MRGPAKIRAVTFDVGGTLIEPWPSVGHVYAEVAARHGAPNLSPVDLAKRFGIAFRRRARSIHSAAEWAEIVDETFAGLVREPPRKTFFPELYERFAQAAAWRIFPDAKPTLAALAEGGIKLGVISNWDSRLRPLLEALDLAGWFEVIVVSCEAGASKPSPVIFLEATRLLGVAATATLHVGDSHQADVLGARGSGLQAIQIARQTPSPGEGQIQSLAELVALLSPGVQ